jgi:hypothetical protein
MRLAELAIAGGFVAGEPSQLGALEAYERLEHLHSHLARESGHPLELRLDRVAGREAFRP